MPKLDMNLGFKIPQQEALKRIKKLLPQIKEQHAEQVSDISETWTDDTVNFLVLFGSEKKLNLSPIPNQTQKVL